ncbi:restriction endonuclease subunit S [Streptomyces sp900116325]|uniref:restriction endonuclease subunit S n=1 Tax=Streptomyces sp. 900116325 TaxID=3154295 RepID=UPI0033BBDF44
MAKTNTSTGGRAATTGIIPGRWALSVGKPSIPAPSGFNWTPLSEIARLESGHTPSRRNPEYWGGNVPWIGIKDATGNHGRTITSTLQTITQAGLNNSSARLLPAGTVCLSRTASVGYVVTMGSPMATSQDFINWVCGPELSPRYLRYILVMEQDSVRRFAHGTTHQTVYYPEAKAFHVCIPSREEQDRIVSTLGALDDKIAVNERIAAVCSELSRSHMEAMWAASPVGSLSNPDASVDGDWVVTTLDELCSAGGGSIQTGPFGSQLHASDYVDAGIPSVMPQNIGDNVINEEGIARISEDDATRLSKYLLQHGDIVYSRRGDVRRRALIRGRESGWLCGTGCLRVRPGNSVDSFFLSHYLSEPEIQDWIARHAVGATMPNLNTKILGSVPVVLPPRAVRDEMSGVLSVLDESSTAAIHESRTLAALRDTLLPELMSGRLRVKDAEKIVEDNT